MGQELPSSRPDSAVSPSRVLRPLLGDGWTWNAPPAGRGSGRHMVHARSTGRITRRQLLGMGVAGGAVLAADALITAPAEAAPAPERPWQHRPQGTTLERTLLRGSPGFGGYRNIVAGPGEPHLVRDDLLSSPAGRSHRGGRRGRLAMGQLTAHA